jgi:hypothetical protein
MSFEYIKRFPAKLAIAFRNRPLSLSLRSLNRNEISEKMKRFNAYIRPFDSALQERPEVFQSVRVDVPFRVALRVIDYLMRVFVRQSFVRAKSVGYYFRTFLNVLADLTVEIVSADALYNLAADARMFFFGRIALQQSHDRRLSRGAGSSVNSFSAPVTMHVPSLAADKSFVRFNSSLHLLNRAVLHRQADSVQHEPAGLLSDAKRASQFARTNPVLRVHNQPRCGQPFVQSQRAIFKDRSHLDGELLPARFAVPNSARQNKFANVFGSAVRAANAARPAHRNHELMALARIAEIANCAGQRLGDVIEIVRSHIPTIHISYHASSI